jgi:hypothetical protein
LRGRYLAIESPSESLPSSTSRNTVAAVNVLVTLAERNASIGSSGRSWSEREQTVRALPRQPDLRSLDSQDCSGDGRVVRDVAPERALKLRRDVERARRTADEAGTVPPTRATTPTKMASARPTCPCLAFMAPLRV